MNNPDNYSNTDPVRYRILAGHAFRKRNELSALSQKAYKKGKRVEAVALSSEAKHELAKARELNNTAASYTFVLHNNDPTSNTINLNGLHAHEADYLLKKRIISKLKNDETCVHIQLDENSHTRNKIVPTIERICCYGSMDLQNLANNNIKIDFEDSYIPKSWYSAMDGYSVYDDWEKSKVSKL